MLVSSIVSKVSGGCDWVVILPRLWQWCRQGSQFWSFAVALAIFLVPLHLSFAFCYCHDWFLLHAETPPLLRWHFLQLVCPAVLVDFWHHFWVSPWCVISVLCSLWMCWPSSTVPRPHRSWNSAGVAMVLDLVFHPKCHFNGWCRKCQVSGWCQCMHFADDGSVVAHSKQWNKQSRHFNMPESSIWSSFSQVLSSDAISIVIRLNCHIWYMPRPSNDFNCQLPFGCLRHPLWRWAWSRRSGSHSSESFPGFLLALAITAPLAKFCFESCWFCSLLSQEGSAGGLSQLLI